MSKAKEAAKTLAAMCLDFMQDTLTEKMFLYNLNMFNKILNKGSVKVMSKITITKEHIANLIDSSKIDDVKMGEKTTVVTLTLPNGFVVVESSSCVDPENYDHELGVDICLKHAVDQIWKLEGYRLQCETYDARVFGQI